MTSWIMVSIAFFGLVGGLIGVYAKFTNDITLLKEKIEVMKADLKYHEQINERTFEIISGQLKDMSCKLDNLIGFLKGSGAIK